jgi:hypothetical protein
MFALAAKPEQALRIRDVLGENAFVSEVSDA